MPGFFERLERASMGDAGVPAYARTHPLTGERIADMDDRARRAPYRQPRQSAEYAFVRARLRILQNRSPTDIANEVRRLRTEVDERTAASPAANVYGVAFGELLAGRYDAAGQALAAARADFERTRQEEGETLRSTPSLDLLEVEIARRAGRNDEAVRLAAAAQQRWPGSHAAIAAHLQALLAARRYADAQARAKVETQADPTRPEWWNFLAQAALGTGDGITQRRALAEKFALDGAWPAAIRQLREASDNKAASFYEQSIIAARLHDFEMRYKEERDEESKRG
jgi:predicted Zn-dependent protease